MSKKKLTPGRLSRRVTDLLNKKISARAPTQTIESGRVGVRQTGAGRPVDLVGMIARLFPAGPQREAAMQQVAAGQKLAQATRAQAAAAQAVAAANVPGASPSALAAARASHTAAVQQTAAAAAQVQAAQTIAAVQTAAAAAEADIGRLVQKQQFAARAVALVKRAKDAEIEALKKQVQDLERGAKEAKAAEKAVLAAQAAALQKEAAEAGISLPPVDVYPGQAPTPRVGNTGILIKTNIRTPHTYRTKAGKTCDTDAWIVYALLVYDASKNPEERGGYDDPWFGMEGPKFRCYYPNSGLADYESIMGTASSGRWLHAWSQWRNYIKF